VKSQLNAEASIFYPGCNTSAETSPISMAISNDIPEPTLRRSARIAERIARQADVVPSEDTNQDLITDSQDDQPGDNYV